MIKILFLFILSISSTLCQVIPLASDETVVVYVNRLGSDNTAEELNIEDLKSLVKENISIKNPRYRYVENQSTSLFIDMLEEYELKAREAKTDANYIEEKAFEFFAEYFFTPPRFRFDTVDPEYKESFDNIKVLYEPRQDQVKIDIVREQVKEIQKKNRVILLTHQQSTRMANEIISKNIEDIEKPIFSNEQALNEVFYKRIANLMLTPFVSEITGYTNSRKRYMLHGNTGFFTDFTNKLPVNYVLDESVNSDESTFNFYLSSETRLEDNSLMRDALVEEIENLVTAVNEDNLCYSENDFEFPKMYLSPRNVVDNKFAFIHTGLEDNSFIDDYTVIGVAKNQELATEYQNFILLEAHTDLNFDSPTYFTSRFFYDFVSEKDELGSEKLSSNDFEYHIVKKSDIYRFLEKKTTECETIKLEKDDNLFDIRFSNELDKNFTVFDGNPLGFKFFNRMPLDVSLVTLNNVAATRVMDSNDFELSLELGNVVAYDKLDVTVFFKNSFGLRYLIEFPDSPLTFNASPVSIDSLASETWRLDNIQVTSSDSSYICTDFDLGTNGLKYCTNGFYTFDYLVTPVAVVGNDIVEDKVRPGIESTSSECDRVLYVIPRLRFTSEDFLASSELSENRYIIYYDKIQTISPPANCE